MEEKGKVINMPKLDGIVTEQPTDVEDTETTQPVDETLAPEIKMEQVKQEFIMIGMTTPNEDLITAIKANLGKYHPIDMTIEEMNFIVNQRADKAQRLEAEAVLNSDENVKRANELANQFFERYKQLFEDQYFIALKDLKQGTTLSWKKFNGVIGTLDMYGHIEWDGDERKMLRIIISKEDMVRNKKLEIQRTLDFAMGQIIQLETSYPEAVKAAEMKKLKSALKLK